MTGYPAPLCLLVYKGRPARLLSSGEKIEIELGPGETLKVRPKDVTLIHPGPLARLEDLHPPAGDPITAWEVLRESVQSFNLQELAELTFGIWSPASAWAAWQLVDDKLYFEGKPDFIQARSSEAVTHEQAGRSARMAESQAWAAFIKRLAIHQVSLPDDMVYLREIEDLHVPGLFAVPQLESALVRELGIVVELDKP